MEFTGKHTPSPACVDKKKVHKGIKTVMYSFKKSAREGFRQLIAELHHRSYK